MTAPRALLLLFVLLASGCVRPGAVAHSGSSTEPRAARTLRTIPGGETRIRTEPDAMLDLSAYDAQDLHEYGLEALEGDNPGLARVAFARLIAEFPASPLAVSARYNLALSAERQGRMLDAASLYLEYVAVIERQDKDEAAELRMHAGILRWEEGDLPGAVVPLSLAVASGDLTIFDQWEARAVLARVAGRGGDWDAGEDELDRIRREIKRHTRTTRELAPWSSAMVWFHAAELYRDRARAQRLLDVDDLAAARRWLDTTASWFLESRRCHKRVLEHRHPDWAGRAALALGSINEDFRAAMLSADTPTGLSADATSTYLRLLEEQTRAFLEKAVEDYRWLLMDSRELRVTGEDVEELKRALRRVEAELELPDSTAVGPGVVGP